MNATLLIVSELLETRRLFAATLTDGVLTVEGTDAGEVISITARSSTLTVRVGSERTIFNVDAVDEVLVNALGGNDRVTLGKLDLPAAVDGGAGDDRIAGGRGDDVITGGDGNDRLSGGNGDDQLFGAAGSDRLFGDAGDDELDGGDGADLLNGGSGFDLTSAGSDRISDVEDQGNGMTPDDNDTDIDHLRPTFETGFGGTILRDRFTPLDTTGFNVSPGSSVISPNLSSLGTGNTPFFNPFTGVTLQSGGVFVTLSNTGDFARSLGQSSGSAGLAMD